VTVAGCKQAKAGADGRWVKMSLIGATTFLCLARSLVRPKTVF
jgi:hypothetical protein